MRRIDAGERPMPEINPAKVCFVIDKARALLGEDVGAEPGASDPADDDERGAPADPRHSVRRELIEFLKELDVDEAAALVALTWIGRGDYDADDWQDAVKAAQGANLEVPPRRRAVARLPSGRARRLRPLVRGIRDRTGGVKA
jgi:Protein of unknown function (DUF3775)